MSHEVDEMSYVGKKPWHKLGTRVPDDISTEGMYKASGLNWSVSLNDLEAVYETAGGEEINLHVPRKKAVVRDDNQNVLGIVGSRYRPIHNVRLFEMCEGLVESDQLRYETAGSLGKGERVWILLAGQEYDVAGEDKVEEYLLVTSSHDGSYNFQFYPTPVRVVCNNTLNAAFRSRSIEFSTRHTENADERIEAAGKILEQSMEHFDNVRGTFETLMDTEFTGEMMERVLRQVIFPPDEDGERSSRAENNIQSIRNLYKAHDYRGTAWGAWQAVTEWADHHKTFRASNRYSQTENRFRSVLFGSASDLKRRALEGIQEQTEQVVA